jgi:hypothetical protein
MFLLKMNDLNLEAFAKLYYLISLKPFVLSTAASLVLSYKSFLLYFVSVCFNSNSKSFTYQSPDTPHINSSYYTINSVHNGTTTDLNIFPF